MGAGRKTQTFTLPDKSVAEKQETHGHGSSTVYSPPTFRNLKKSDLAGVIFGCTNSTLVECQNRKLFGLPSTHFSYVKNIGPGLPLFLFNYTEKVLYGIFEAASDGKFKIEPRAWTRNEREITLYPAQVRTAIKEQCPALPEIQFKQIIKNNYYEEKHFHFELDRAQTQKLIALFRTSRPATNTSVPQTTTRLKQESMPRAMPPPPTSLGFAHPGRDKSENYTAGGGTYAKDLAEKVAVSVILDDEVRDPNRQNACPPTWSSVLFKTEKRSPDVNLSVPCSSDPVSGNVGNNSSKPSLGESEKSRVGYLSTGRTNEALNSFNPIVGSASSSHRASYTEASSSGPESNTESSSEDLDSGNHPLEVVEERENLMEPICSIVSQLVGEVGKLKLSHLEQQKIISKLEQDVVRTRLEIQCLKGKWEGLDGQLIEKTGSLKEEPEPTGDQTLGGSIIVVGGHDNCSYLKTTECYVPSVDLTEPRCPMRILLKHSSATKLRDEIYLLGGGINQAWHDEVESYNPFSDKWSSFPSLRRKKGNLASVSFNDKIYAIGGRDEDECFSEMDMYLLDHGSWTSSKPMLQQRFSHGAAEINGAIYVVGGFDQNVYLSSTERFDPRERSWTRLESMPTNRACHSLVVLNEKLFAVGGYDGNKAVSTVDIFDPRRGSWMAGEPMNDCRLYATAVVVRDQIYALGGMTDNHDFLNTVEYYKEGHGWEVAKLKGVGKRLYFSAIAL